MKRSAIDDDLDRLFGPPPSPSIIPAIDDLLFGTGNADVPPPPTPLGRLIDSDSESDDEVIAGHIDTSERSNEPIHFAKRRRCTFKHPQDSRAKLWAQNCGLTCEQFFYLWSQGWPIVMFNLLTYINYVYVGPILPDIDAVEYFSGTATIVGSFMANGRKALEFDYIHNPIFQSLTSGPGFLTAVLYAMMIVPGGLAHFATICSTWVFLSRSTTGRSRLFPYGTPDEPGMCTSNIREGNMQVGRMVLLVMLLRTRQVFWSLEQPMSSLMDRAAIIIDNIPERVKTTFNMGAFGGSSKKPSWLISDNAPWLKELKRDISPEDAAHFDSSENAKAGISSTTGKKHVTGGANLKDTQAYPPRFGGAMFETWMRHGGAENNLPEMPKVENFHGKMSIHTEMDYAIAELQNVADYCGISFTEWLFDRDPKDVFPQ